MYEVIDWAYEGGCTPKQAHTLLAECGVSVPYNTVYKRKPEFKKYVADYARAYRMRNGKTWERKKAESQSYEITDDGSRMLALGSVFGEDFTYTTTMGVLRILHSGEADDCVMVERLRELGVFGNKCSCGGQLGLFRRTLGRMERDGLIQRAP